MGSNYKKLGAYIQIVNERNSSLSGHKLLGVSIKKCFIPSIANIIGTDMSTYKLIRKKQFAYGPVTSRNGDKISIALLEELDEAIVSQAYTVFEIRDFNELDPEYLMMWFRRPEFDRYARFKSHGSAREIFDWAEICETELPIPTIEKQREIVQEYHTIVNRISLNERLIQKLEETAQAIYKNWFVDFEFPDENGLPYKSSGGTLVWCENLEKEIPEGWIVGKLEQLVEFRNGKLKPKQGGVYPVYGGNGIIAYVNDFNAENVIPIGRVGAYCGSLYREINKCWISDNAISGKSKINCNMFTYFLMNDLHLNEKAEGTGQPLITQGLLNGIEIVIPKIDFIQQFEEIVLTTFKFEKKLIAENEILLTLKDLLLSRMTKVEIEKEFI